MVFLDHHSCFFRSFIGRIRAFRLPIHLEAKSATLRRLALRDPLRDGFLRRGCYGCRWHGYGFGALSLPLNDLIKMLLGRRTMSHSARSQCLAKPFAAPTRV